MAPASTCCFFSLSPPHKPHSKVSAEEIHFKEQWTNPSQTISKGKPLNRLSSQSVCHPRRRPWPAHRKASLGGWNEKPACPSPKARALGLKTSVSEPRWKQRAHTARVLSCRACTPRTATIETGICPPRRGAQTPGATSRSDAPGPSSRMMGTRSPRWRPRVSPIVSSAGAGIGRPLRLSRAAKAAGGRTGGEEASLRQKTGPYRKKCPYGRVVCFGLFFFLFFLHHPFFQVFVCLVVWPFCVDSLHCTGSWKTFLTSQSYTTFALRRTRIDFTEVNSGKAERRPTQSWTPLGSCPSATSQCSIG